MDEQRTGETDMVGVHRAMWCVHCTLTTPMPLARAIIHRQGVHADCINCQVEAQLAEAFMAGAQSIEIIYGDYQPA